jgi:hypothetical protein
VEASRRARLTLVFFAKPSRVYTGARVRNSHFNVYHGDFRKKRANSRTSVSIDAKTVRGLTLRHVSHNVPTSG